MQNIELKFSRILKYMGISEDLIQMDASFKKDFEFNEFQFSFLCYYIKSYFKINICQKDYASLDTIGNTLNFIQERIR